MDKLGPPSPYDMPIKRNRYRIPRAIALTATLLGCVILAAQTRVDKRAFRLPAKAPEPKDNKGTPARIELGKMLFFDPRLSGSNWISCATCHNPALGWSDGLPTGIGNGMAALPRATPSIVNSAFNDLQMWDGLFHSLEEQAVAPIEGAGEMNGKVNQILTNLRSIPGYAQEFAKAYPGEGISKETLAKAIACFERTVISTSSPFDLWMDGSQGAISLSAKRGFALFVGKANCVACHRGPNFTDQGFHNIGLKTDTDEGRSDEGRFARVPIKISKGAFKTPTLRDVARTAPYMHNGAYRTLDEVVEHYDRGGVDKQNLDPNIKPLGLCDQDKKDLVAFMKTLSGKPMTIVVPTLPQ